MGADAHPGDIGGGFAGGLHLAVQRHGRLHGGLGMELRRERNFKQHVLHHIRAVRPLEAERFAVERDVVESPGRRRERRGIAHLAGGGHQRQPHRTRGRIPRRPGFTGAGVRRVAVGAQRLPVHPRQRHRVQDRLAAQAEQLRHHRGGRHLYQQHVIQPHPVEGVFQRQAALDLMRLDHGDQHLPHGQRRFARRHRLAREPVGHRQDPAQVVRRVAPLRRQPGVVEVEPADHGADIERRLHRIQLETGAGHPAAVQHLGARHHRPHQFLAGRVAQRLQPAAEGIEQAIMGGAVRRRGIDGLFHHIIDDIDHFAIERRTAGIGRLKHHDSQRLQSENDTITTGAQR
ncbi:Uncharacterised protein [Acinetobacter baumannii]|nr:Uncharacterised protein [Acinetobacter baumannii]